MMLTILMTVGFVKSIRQLTLQSQVTTIFMTSLNKALLIHSVTVTVSIFLEYTEISNL